jgi:hypothetical protein
MFAYIMGDPFYLFIFINLRMQEETSSISRCLLPPEGADIVFVLTCLTLLPARSSSKTGNLSSNPQQRWATQSSPGSVGHQCTERSGAAHRLAGCISRKINNRQSPRGGPRWQSCIPHPRGARIRAVPRMRPLPAIPRGARTCAHAPECRGGGEGGA